MFPIVPAEQGMPGVFLIENENVPVLTIRKENGGVFPKGETDPEKGGRERVSRVCRNRGSIRLYGQRLPTYRGHTRGGNYGTLRDG